MVVLGATPVLNARGNEIMMPEVVVGTGLGSALNVVDVKFDSTTGSVK